MPFLHLRKWPTVGHFEGRRPYRPQHRESTSVRTFSKHVTINNTFLLACDSLQIPLYWLGTHYPLYFPIWPHLNRSIRLHTWYNGNETQGSPSNKISACKLCVSPKYLLWALFYRKQISNCPLDGKGPHHLHIGITNQRRDLSNKYFRLLQTWMLFGEESGPYPKKLQITNSRWPNLLPLHNSQIPLKYYCKSVLWHLLNVAKTCILLKRKSPSSYLTILLHRLSQLSN